MAIEKIREVAGTAVPVRGNNIDTDRIIPARFLRSVSFEGLEQHLFEDDRAQAGGDHPLSKPIYAGAALMFVNANFGCGSSREGAAFAFHDAGFRSVIAPSFSDIFYANCLKNGIVPVRLSPEACDALRQALYREPGMQLTVDLEKQVVVEPGGTRHRFDVDAFYREMLLKGVDELGLTLSLKDEIEAFEARYARAYPWAMR